MSYLSELSYDVKSEAIAEIRNIKSRMETMLMSLMDMEDKLQ